VISHYRDHPHEASRLADGHGQIEFLRTQEVITRYLPAGPLRILDVGGAVGTYSAWLASEGHEVELLDPVEEQVAEARRRAGSPPAFTARVGDARDLGCPDASCDAVLLLGPLYHLVERADRLRALGEAWRVLKAGGLVFGAAISRFASLHDGLARGFIYDTTFQGIVKADLTNGQHRNPTDRPEWFTTAYFHHPAELADEAREAGLRVHELVGLEGLAGWLPNVADRWGDREAREVILGAARAVEAEPSLLGLSAHLLVVATPG
jgi:ubiquinone/menaquinone biosynthesis C-methylase UbiE